MRIRGLNIHTKNNPHRPKFTGPDKPTRSFFQPFPEHHLAKLASAIQIMVAKSTNNPQCDRVFRASGNGNTLAELLAGNDIWVSYNPMTNDSPEAEGAAPAGFAHQKEILLFEQGMMYSPLILASVLTHELDHVNGVGGMFMPLDRNAHGMADHAALNCTGVISPRTVMLNELSAYGVSCDSCRPIPSVLDR